MSLDQFIVFGLSKFKSGWLSDVQEDVVPSRVGKADAAQNVELRTSSAVSVVQRVPTTFTRQELLWQKNLVTFLAT
jgi:hypothetical protein